MITIILARFPLRSKVLGPTVVNFMRFWSRDVPLHPETPRPYQSIQLNFT